jgi:hypothetical protein
VNERIIALRAHLDLCERVQQLLSEERSHWEGNADVRSDTATLTEQRRLLLVELQSSLERLRRSEAPMVQADPNLQAECSRLVSAARDATLAVLQQQSEVETLMLNQSLRRPKIDTASAFPTTAAAARVYFHASSPIAEKPFDSRAT